MCVCSVPASLCGMCGSASKPNTVQASRQCVCPHPSKEQVQVKVSVLIPPQASHPVFLSHSFFLSFSH